MKSYGKSLKKDLTITRQENNVNNWNEDCNDDWNED